MNINELQPTLPILFDRMPQDFHENDYPTYQGYRADY